jgi:hypothetical protein
MSIDNDLRVASLLIDAFAALKGWGQVREDGKWQAWSNAELRSQAIDLVNWALRGCRLDRLNPEMEGYE